MNKPTLQERAAEYKLKTGYSSSSPKERKAIAEDLISALSILQDQENKSLIQIYKRIRKGD